MPTSEHEAVAELMGEAPDDVAELVTNVLQVPLPPYARARVAEAELSQAKPLERRADRVIVYEDARGRALAVIVLEVQRRIDARKRRAWQAYLAFATARYRCRSMVLVVTSSRKTERWARKGVLIDPRTEWAPYVLGPEAMPRIDDEEKLREQPMLAILSALTHAEDVPHLQKVYRCLQTGTLPSEEKSYYWDVIQSAASPAVRELLQKGMPMLDLRNYKPKSAGSRAIMAEAERLRAEGEAKGKAEDILNVLKVRKLKPTVEERARILDCKDVKKLTLWLKRAITAESVSRIFAQKRQVRRSPAVRPSLKTSR